MDQATRVTSLELIKKGIRVNSVNPGVIETPIFATAGLNEEQVAKFYQDRLEKMPIRPQKAAFFLCSCRTHPIGRVGQPREVATAIAFLASPVDASFIVGQTLAVDGGRSVTCPHPEMF